MTGAGHRTQAEAPGGSAGTSFGAGPGRTGDTTVQRSELKAVESVGLGRLLILVVALGMLAPVALAAGTSAAITGIVCDNDGVAQMGAMVQVLGSDASTVGTAFTDLHGHYLIRNIVPGMYQVRASATLFVPVTRANLHLRTGAKTVVNLTLATLFDTTSWLPAERRRADEPADDWRWTLRSSASRPMLKILDDGTVELARLGEMPGPKGLGVRVAVNGGNGGFAEGGIHSTISTTRSRRDGSDVLLRADIATNVMGGPGATAPASNVALGYERAIGLVGSARTMLNYRSNPELIGPDGRRGLSVLQVAGAQHTSFGDMLDLEIGGRLLGVHTATADGFLSSPFVRLTARPTGSWTLHYRMATARDMQGIEDLNPHAELPAMTPAPGGRLLMEKGRHQEIAISHGAGKGVIQVSVYHDAMDRMAVGGVIGAPGSLNMAGGILLDPVTGSFRALTAGYRGNGAQILFSSPLPAGMLATVEYSTGMALSAPSNLGSTLQGALDGLKPRSGQAAGVSVKGRLKTTGTTVRALYRWQPDVLVTAVNPYGAYSDQGHISLSAKQPLKWGNRLPPGIEATIDVTNLLAHGYQPFLSADGQTLYFTQSPRTLQAGLSFSF
jgi:hypothetical protein